MSPKRIALAALLIAAPALAQTTDDPFPTPITENGEATRVGYTEFARVPDFDGQPARMMTMVPGPGTDRLFVSDMRGRIYSVSSDGRTVRPWLDLDDRRWAIGVTSESSETGLQSFVFHPQFSQQGAPGYGKLYTWTDVGDTSPAADFTTPGEQVSHHTVLHEWTARNPAAADYDGGAPRVLLREAQPFRNHNGGEIAFDPTASEGDPDFGLLYIGSADGGSGGDPMDLAQNLSSAFGKILRIDPLGSNSGNGEYGIPEDNPFVGRANALGEIYAYGVRNPQRFGWDPANGRMYMADIGQGTVETLNPVTAGANLGWNDWEGSFRFASRSAVDVGSRRGDRAITYPVAEYDQTDPLLQRQSAATGVIVYRSSTVPQLNGRIIWGDNPSGEVFHVSADSPPNGGQEPIRRVLLNDEGQAKTLLQLIRETNAEQGREPASRADLRFGWGPNGQVFLLNKRDGVIRLLTR